VIIIIRIPSAKKHRSCVLNETQSTPYMMMCENALGLRRAHRVHRARARSALHITILLLRRRRSSQRVFFFVFNHHTQTKRAVGAAIGARRSRLARRGAPPAARRRGAQTGAARKRRPVGACRAPRAAPYISRPPAPRRARTPRRRIDRICLARAPGTRRGARWPPAPTARSSARGPLFNKKTQKRRAAPRRARAQPPGTARPLRAAGARGAGCRRP
jgi:hypothetical protein